MFRILLLLAFSQVILGQGYTSNYVLEQVRNLTNSWTPGNNPTPKWLYKSGLWLKDDPPRLPVGVLAVMDEVELPEQFDAREKWPECPSLRAVRNQGCCGSCWAVSAAAAMSDRWCVHSANNSRFNFGAFDLVSCCYACGDGCKGGDLAPTWQYWVQTGVSSGGPYNSRQGCHSYPFDVCQSPDEDDSAPRCNRKCQPGYKEPTSYEDRRFGRVAYSLPVDEKRIMEEVYRNGPVQAGFKVYTDFQYYRSGVYRHVTGALEGGHAVKVLGWGVEKGVKYWLCANSWGEDWGQNGFFKIVRGENHCGVESQVHAGLPHYTKHLQLKGAPNLVQS